MAIPDKVSPLFTTYVLSVDTWAFEVVGITRYCPTYIKLGLLILLSLTISSTVVPYFLAIFVKLSPLCTSYDTVALSTGGVTTVSVLFSSCGGISFSIYLSQASLYLMPFSSWFLYLHIFWLIPHLPFYYKLE